MVFIQLLICLLCFLNSIWADPSAKIKNKSYPYDLAICAIFQNEAPYLKEWIEFHKLVGVQHFYLYNNLSTDDYITVLAPYIDTKEVDLVDWPYPKTSPEHWYEIQCAAYD